MKQKILILFVFCVTLLSSVPAYAKQNQSDSLYKQFLAKGVYSVTEKEYQIDSSTGKIHVSRDKYTFKIDEYALANLDGKGEPEMILLSRVNRGKKTAWKKVYYVNIAYIKGGKVKIAPLVFKTSLGKKRYNLIRYTLGSSYYELDCLNYYPSLGVLDIRLDMTRGSESGSFSMFTAYYYHNGKTELMDRAFGDTDKWDEKYNKMSSSKCKTAKILLNTARNRVRSFG